MLKHFGYLVVVVFVVTVLVVSIVGANLRFIKTKSASSVSTYKVALCTEGKKATAHVASNVSLRSKCEDARLARSHLTRLDACMHIVFMIQNNICYAADMFFFNEGGVW